MKKGMLIEHFVFVMRVSKWKEIGVDVQKNCIFVDEAGFNTHMIRERAWSKIGEPANITIQKQKRC